MKINVHQLTNHLKKHLASYYCLWGEEELLITEACTQIKQAAKQHGFTEIIRLTIESDKDWHQLLLHQQSQSLFSDKVLIECSLAKNSVGKVGSSTLKTIFENNYQNKLLIFLPGKVEKQSQNSAWFKAFDSSGVMIAAPNLKGEQLKQWMSNRINGLNLKVTPEALDFLYQQTQGNVLASAQEIDKLPLLGVNSTITIETLTQALTDSSQFNVFELTDAILQDDLSTSLKILTRLQNEQIEPILILWALSKQCRELAQVAFFIQQGQSIQQAMTNTHIWQTRKNNVAKTLSKQPLSHWQTCLTLAYQADKVIKGVFPGNAWEVLQQLLLVMVGQNNYMIKEKV